jgi:PAS domain-containing protein
MTQGLLMFDSSQRLVVCNQRYIEMFGLSPEVAKPGCSLHDLITHRKQTGSLKESVDEHCSLVLSNAAELTIAEPRMDAPSRSHTGRLRAADG